MADNLEKADRPASSIALVGAGPAAMFTAEELLKSGRVAEVVVHERLSLPYGLVRYGVAPDHPHTRRIEKLLDRIAAMPGFRLITGKEVGRDITVETLCRQYDAVIMAVGAEDDRALGIPGEALPGCHSSLEFSAWANGHPDFLDAPVDLGVGTAVILGNGNVALDAARLLARGFDELRNTDMHPNALVRFAASQVRTIIVAGRRGPVQSSFGAAELAEVGALPNAGPRVAPEEVDLNDTSAFELREAKEDRVRETYETLRSWASSGAGTPLPQRQVQFRFFLNPVAFEGTGRVNSVVFEETRLEGEPFRQRAVGTGRRVTIPCGLVIKAIGHRGHPIPGLPFDETRGVIPTQNHRVVENGAPRPGLYAVGWCKRGAHGLIGHNRRDAMETVDVVLADLEARRQTPRGSG